MRVAVTVPTVRPDLTGTFLDSLARHRQPVHEVHVIAQRHTREVWEELLAAHPVPHKVVLEWHPEGGPVYPLRWNHAAVHPEIDVWVQCDDDMELLELTHWGPMIDAVHGRRFAVVSGNWVRTPSPAMIARRWPPQPNQVWLPVPFTNMAGGMAVPKRIVPLLVARERAGTGMADWLHDDVQVGLTAYVHGLQPARYRGSLLVHRVLTAGGLNGPSGLFATRKHQLLDPSLVRTRTSKGRLGNGNDVMMVVPSDLQPQAHVRHANAAAQILAHRAAAVP